MTYPEKEELIDLPPKVNDFCMTVCTVNGSGSATSNNVLYHALFHMGIPLSLIHI